MTAELTAEQVVTNLLSSHQILKSGLNDVKITSSLDLGAYLEYIKKEETVSKNEIELNNESIKYSFIKNKLTTYLEFYRMIIKKGDSI